MKKAIAVLAIVLMFSGAAFASNAEIIANGGLSLQFLPVEENAIVNPALLGSYVRTAVLGVTLPILGTGPSTLAPQGTGLVIVSAGPGVLGIVAGPRQLTSADELLVGTTNPSVNGIPQSTVNVGYALDLKGLKAGLSVAYGVNNTSNKLDWNGGVAIVGKDEAYVSDTVLKLTLGAGLNVGMPLDIAVSLVLPKYESVIKDFDNSQNKLQSNPTVVWGAQDIVIDAKTELASMLWALNVTLGSLSYVNTTWVDANLDGDAGDAGDTWIINTEADSSLGVNLLTAKVIKATETLSIKFGTGLKMLMYGDYKETTENKVLGTRTVDSAAADSGMKLTVPLNLAVSVALGKILNIENGKHSLTMGISKEAAVINNWTDKTINAPANENTDDLTTHSDFNNVTPVVGGLGWQYELGDFKSMVSGGAAVYYGASGAVSIQPNFGANFIYTWK